MLGEIDHVAMAHAVLQQALRDAFFAKEHGDKKEAMDWLTGKTEREWLDFWCVRGDICPDRLVHRMQVIVKNPEMIEGVKSLLRKSKIIMVKP
jgi:hypothetical protein